MNRRRFLQLASLTILALTTTAVSCQDRLAGLVLALGNGISALASAVGHNDWADKLRHDTDVIVAAIRAWSEGHDARHIIRMLNDLIRDIKLLEPLDKFKPLITFALGTAASIIEFFNRNLPGGEQPDTPVRITQPPRNAHEFRLDWDAVRASSPNMQEAPVL